MIKMVSLTALLTGLLLLLVPRYILPACEYEGYPPMHCSDTAKAEFLVGAILMVIGGISLFSKKNIAAAVAAAACILYAVAFWLPDKIGYCHSSRMPCNYGMVPGIRFISIAGVLIMIVAFVSILRKSSKKGIP